MKIKTLKVIHSTVNYTKSSHLPTQHSPGNSDLTSVSHFVDEILDSRKDALWQTCTLNPTTSPLLTSLISAINIHMIAGMCPALNSIGLSSLDQKQPMQLKTDVKKRLSRIKQELNITLAETHPCH
jgi:hypothetical protein